MRIISRGTKPEDYLYEGTCSNCKTKFECQKHEGQLNSGSQRDGPYLSVHCPVCGKVAYAYKTNRSAPHSGKYNRNCWDPVTWGTGAQIAAIEKFGVVER